MRIATWNVNSLKARQEAVERWLARAEPDVLLIQETKLSDADAPVMPMRMLGYEMAHHGEGRWNGVAILSRVGLDDVVTNFGDGPVRDSSAGRRWRSRRTTSTRSTRRAWCPPCAAACGSSIAVRARTAASVGSPFFEGKLRWFERLARWLAETRSPDEPLVLGGDYNVTPGRRSTSGARPGPTAARTCPSRSARRWPRLRAWGLVDAYRTQRPEAGRFSWWDYRAGMFHRNEGMRIDLLYATAPVADARRLGGDRPRGAQGTADALRPRAGGHRPRRARPPVRRRLDGRDRADRREDEAAPLNGTGAPWGAGSRPLAPWGA